MIETTDVSPYVAREMARLYPERWTYDVERSELAATVPLHIAPQGAGLAPRGGGKEACMPRVTYRQVTFRLPFHLTGLDGRQPAGTYTVETEEALLETYPSVVYRRIATLMHVATAAGILQGLPINPDDLELALARDAQ